MKRERERVSLLQKRLSPWLHPHITTWCRHLFILTFFFMYWWVIDTNRLLFYPVLLLTYERPLAFNIILARVRLHSHRLHDYCAPVSLFSFCLMRVCVWVQSWPSHLCVSVGRVDQYEKEKPGKKKKSSTRPLPLRFSARSSQWRLVYWMCECMRMSVCCRSTSKTERH